MYVCSDEFTGHYLCNSFSAVIHGIRIIDLSSCLPDIKRPSDHIPDRGAVYYSPRVSVFDLYLEAVVYSFLLLPFYKRKQMGRSPDWMPDILLRADGYETSFYKKD